MIVEIDQSVPVFESYASERTRGLFNVDPEDGARFRLTADVPIEGDDWSVGVVVGPSGSGKTSIARAISARFYEWTEAPWPAHAPIIDYLAKKATYAKATASLSAVGLGSVPSWLRPYGVLSNGERFRADMAALLLDDEPRVYIDEVTSVLDRQVAGVAVAAFVKSWRRQPGRQVVLVTPHYDVLSPAQPDWIVDTAGAERLGEPGRALADKLPGGRERFPGPEVGSFTVGGGRPATYDRRA